MLEGQTKMATTGQGQFSSTSRNQIFFSEFNLIFDLVFGFYCSEQKQRQNMEIKSY